MKIKCFAVRAIDEQICAIDNKAIKICAIEVHRCTTGDQLEMIGESYETEPISGSAERWTDC